MKGTSPSRVCGEVAASGKDMSIITIGIDLAKTIFSVHGINESGKAELVKPKVGRDQLLPLIANLRRTHKQ